MARVSAVDSAERKSPVGDSMALNFEHDDASDLKANEEGKRDQNQNLSDFADAELTSSSSNSDLAERLRQIESEKVAVIVDHNNMMRNYNDRMEIYLHEIRVLQELNKGLQNDLNELRELCCYLDDDRRNCRRVAKEWQKFGRYTVTVMRNEVISYSDKLGQLESKQTDLIKENGELRDLCLYLDNKRKSEEPDEEDKNVLKFVICSECKNLRKEEDGVSSGEGKGSSTGRLDQNDSNDYINKLEARIRQLEAERDFFIMTFASKKEKKEKKRVSFSVPEDDGDSSSLSELDRSESLDFPFRSPVCKDNQPGILRNGFLSPPPKRDKAVNMSSESSNRVTQAMRVLEIQEKLDRGSTSSTGSEDPMNEHEIAILKQMCNAAWSKLGDDQQVPLPSMLPPFNAEARAAENGPVSEAKNDTAEQSYNQGHLEDKVTRDYEQQRLEGSVTDTHDQEPSGEDVLQAYC